MNTKEAIEFLTKEYDVYKDTPLENGYESVIKCLQRGEKFEKMFGEVEMKFKTLHTDFESGEEYYAGVINESDIKDIKQKYFPK